MNAEEAAARWRRWSARGPAEALNRMLSTLDANLPAGWRRAREVEVRTFRTFGEEVAAWYRLDKEPPQAKGALTLVRQGESALSGGPVWFQGPLGAPGEPAVPPKLGRGHALSGRRCDPRSQIGTVGYQTPHRGGGVLRGTALGHPRSAQQVFARRPLGGRKG